MEAKELRVGNWIKDDEDCIHQILGIDSQKEYEEKHGTIQVKEYINKIHISYGGRWLDDIYPIPLTPEILEKAGFKKTSGSIYLHRDILRLGRIEYLPEENACYLDFEGTQCGINIKHVHQLQNLYFALTGEELTIEL